jgi:hypothetical protein
MSHYVYELAETKQEAAALFSEGFGYSSRKDAVQAIRDAVKAGADPFYVNKWKIFRFKEATP